MQRNGTGIAELDDHSRHHPRHHAAARTRDYVFAQLIPYIGNKRKLLHLIGQALHATGLKTGVFADLFTGSTVVARFAKRAGFRVLANDWEPYAYEIARGTVGINSVPGFKMLGGADHVIQELNSLPPVHGYVARHLCPADDDCPDPLSERMFFTRANGERIDAIRGQIAAWESAGAISPDERAYLLAGLLYAVSYASNTSGVFKGFHHGWGGKTRTALYRILAPLALRPPVLFDNGQPNLACSMDAHVLAPRLGEQLGARPDVVYLDPPYNQHPYGSNYHVLTTVALWDQPPVAKATRVNGRTRDKSAIRKDWRQTRRSAYNSAAQALPALRDLLTAIDARWIMMSYSTDGNIAVEDLLRALAERGRAHLFAQPYKRYRVSTPRMSPRSHNVEFVALLDTRARPSPSATDSLIDVLRRQEGSAKRTSIRQVDS